MYAYLLAFALTVVWSLYEAGFAFWPLVPRLVAPVALGAAALFIAPSLRRSARPVSNVPYALGEFAMTTLFVATITALFFPHDLIRNDRQLTLGRIGKTTQAAGDNWYAYGRTVMGARFVPADQITPANIQGLTVAWTAHTGFIAD